MLINPQNQPGLEPTGLGPRWLPRPCGIGRPDRDPPKRGVWDNRRGRRPLFSAGGVAMPELDGAVQNNDLQWPLERYEHHGAEFFSSTRGWVRG